MRNDSTEPAGPFDSRRETGSKIDAKLDALCRRRGKDKSPMSRPDLARELGCAESLLRWVEGRAIAKALAALALIRLEMLCDPGADRDAFLAALAAYEAAKRAVAQRTPNARALTEAQRLFNKSLEIDATK